MIFLRPLRMWAISGPVVLAAALSACSTAPVVQQPTTAASPLAVVPTMVASPRPQPTAAPTVAPTPASPTAAPTATPSWTFITVEPVPTLPVPGADGRIYFLTTITDTTQLAISNPDGSGQVLVTRRDFGDIDAFAISPDATHIAVAVDRGDFADLDVYVMNADGSEPRPLADSSRSEYAPAWSPDGTMVAFVVATGAADCIQRCNKDIFRINADRGGLQQLTTDPEPDHNPRWSPDGKHIAFERGCTEPYQDCAYGVYRMDRDGGAQTRIAPTLQRSWGPHWLSNGLIAFQTILNKKLVIRTANANRTQIRTYVAMPLFADRFLSDFVAAPDERTVLITVQRDACAQGNPCTRQIYALATSGGPPQQLTNDGSWNSDPAWSLDSRRIAFVSNRDGPETLYVMNADGSAVQRIATQFDNAREPVWVRPAPDIQP